MDSASKLVILFADVVGSTQLYELLGDDKARETVTRCMQIMSDATHSHAGTVIKTMGDEVMSTFERVDDALDAAAEIHRAISDSMVVEGESITVRIGCHYGPVMLENGDVFGSAVHTASRMAGQAKAAQIITTAETVRKVSQRWRSQSRKIDITPVRGQTGDVVLYEVLWKHEEEATSMLHTIDLDSLAQARQARLTLSYRGQQVVVSDKHPVITVGRAEDCDLIVSHHLISRLHARIEFSRGKFMLVDLSTNGTYVIGRDGDKQFVRRDNIQLKDEGVLGFGRLPELGSPQDVSFRCESDSLSRRGAV